MKQQKKNMAISEKSMHLWLSIWLYVMAAIGGILITYLFTNWNTLQMSQICTILAVVILILHVFEEWHFPGGFHYQYNIQMKSDIPDRYPMDQVTDMLTNFTATVFGCICVFMGIPYITAIMWFVLSFMEVILHTTAGFSMRKRFAAKGKKTIYNPGLVTCWIGFIPVSIGYIVTFVTVRTPSFLECVFGFVLTIAFAVCLVSGGEKALKNRDTKYPYTWGNGYYTKYAEN